MQSSGDWGVERHAHFRRDRGDGGDRLRVQRDELRHRGRRPREVARQALERHDTERVHVAGRRGGGAGQELGGEVCERPDDRPARRQHRQLRVLFRASQPEVGEPRPALVEEDVVRLDVPMDEPAAVEISEPVGNGGNRGRELARVEPTTRAQAICQRAPGTPLHDVEPLTTGRRVAGLDVKDLDDARVCRRCECQGLARKALRECRVCGEVRQEHLDCDGAFEPEVVGAIHRRHPARADRRLDAVPPS